MWSPKVGPLGSVPSSSGSSLSEKTSHSPKIKSVALLAIGFSSDLSFSPIVTKVSPWKEEDSRLSLEPMSLDDKTSQSEDSQDSLGTCEFLACDEPEKTSRNCKRKRDDNDEFKIELEENLSLEKSLWDSKFFRDAQMPLGKALQRNFGPLCQKEKERVEIYKKFLDFLSENLQEDEFSEQKNFLKVLHQKNLFRIEDINRPAYLKQSFDKIEKQLIRVIRTLSQEKIGSLLSQSLDKSEIQSVKHLLELSALYQEIDTLLDFSYDFRMKEHLYEFPKEFAMRGYGDEAIALVGEFSSHFRDKLSESRVLLAVAKILAKQEGGMGKAVKALNAIEDESVKQEFLSHLKYVE